MILVFTKRKNTKNYDYIKKYPNYNEIHLEQPKERNSWYKINDNIEFCVDVKTPDKVDEEEPFNLLNLEYYYNNFLKDSDREKDKEKKELIKKYLGGK